jgi:two-component system, sensor histidine kinase and response regulator
LEDDGLSDATRRAFEKIESAGSRIRDMIDLSLDLVKMERGVYELTPVDFDVVEVLDQVLADVETLRRVKDIEVEIFSGEAPVGTNIIYAYGEKILLRSALLNLLKNAIEASPEHETVTVEIKVGSLIEICLRNAGAVPVEMRSRFFEKYATLGKRGGTGLGTYSARLLVETMSGSISLDFSDPDSTAVIVTMPVR